MKLYYAPGACSLGIHVILEEIGKPYETEKVNLKDGEQYQPAYLAVSAKSKVPALRRDDGSVLTEYGAIATWLARTNPDSKLLPADPDGEARAIEAMDYIVSTVHMQGFARVTRPGNFAPDEAEKEAVQARGRDIFAKGLGLLNAVLAGKDWIAGDYSMADPTLFYVSSWAPRAGVELPARAFWFLRHGETDWNVQGVSQGRTDIPLNPTGVAQAAAAAQVLRGRGIASIVSSPLGRARVTAEAVGTVLGLPVSIVENLQEVCFGVHEGTLQHASWFTAWIAGEHTPEGAESFAELRRRAVAGVTAALAQASPVLVVAHGALFRALRAEMGLPADIRTPNALPLLCEPGEAPGQPWSLTAVTNSGPVRPANA